MNARILTLMALLSLTALAAGYPTQNDQRDRTEMDALKLINEIAREQVFKQGRETADEQQRMSNVIPKIKLTANNNHFLLHTCRLHGRGGPLPTSYSLLLLPRNIL